MSDIKYEKLDRIREDIRRDKAKVAKLTEAIRIKEAKLKEAEASQIVADVGAMNMSPEQLGEFLQLIKSGGIKELLGRDAKTNEEERIEQEDTLNEELYEDEEDGNSED